MKRQEYTLCFIFKEIILEFLVFNYVNLQRILRDDQSPHRKFNVFSSMTFHFYCALNYNSCEFYFMGHYSIMLYQWITIIL